MFLDLSNVQELVTVFKIAHLNCGKAHAVCHRLGIKGFPTISVLEGEKIYDYQGRLTVDGLSSFITKKIYLERSKPRRIMHVRTPYENLAEALHEMTLKCRAFTMLLFKFFGLGHLDEEFVIQTVYMMALAPFILFLIALVVERRQLQTQRENTDLNKVKAE